MDNIARLMAMYDEDGLSHPDTDALSAAEHIRPHCNRISRLGHYRSRRVAGAASRPVRYTCTHDACPVTNGCTRCLTPLLHAEISLVQTQRWSVGLRKWITTAGGVGLGGKLNVRDDFVHPLPLATVQESTVVRSGEIDVVELYHAFPTAIAATMRAQGNGVLVWKET